MRQQKKRDIRRAEMFQIIDQQIKSGLSQMQFCKKQKMSIATFSYWRQKYSTRKNESPSNHFVPIKIKTILQKNEPIEIVLPNKIILRCAAWQSDQLPTLLSQLQNIKSSC